MAATIKFGDYCHMGMNQLAPFIGKYSIADGSTICHVKNALHCVILRHGIHVLLSAYHLIY